MEQLVLRHDAEHGTTAIFIAAAMLVLLGIAAFAVDYTAALGDRRGNVGAADTAALAGLVLGVTTIDSDALDAAVNEVIDVAAADVNEPITPMDWSTCSDPDALAIVSAASPCISFDANYSRIRVVLPDRETPTAFGSLMGVDSITTSAAAEAAVNPSLFTTAFPAVAYANASPGDEICIPTRVPPSASPESHTCGGLPETDFLSPFDPVPFTGPNACATNPSLIPFAMVHGISHTFGASAGIGSRANTCISGSGVPFPNILVERELSNNQLTTGLLGPSALANGRLSQSPGPPLWDFIDDSLGLVTPSCEQVRLIPANPDPDDVEAAELLLKQCLASHSGVLFSQDLLESRRFVVVPKASQSTPTGSAHITAFQPVYLHGSYFTHTAPPPPDDGEEPEEEEIAGCIIGEGFCKHQPGLGPVPTGLDFINSASALVIRCEHLPENACSRAGPSRTYVVKFELVR